MKLCISLQASNAPELTEKPPLFRAAGGYLEPPDSHKGGAQLHFIEQAPGNGISTDRAPEMWRARSGVKCIELPGSQFMNCGSAALY
jgi:hypothetical protein